MEIEVYGNVSAVSLDQKDMDNSETMNAMQEYMDACADEYNSQINKTAEQYQISDNWAMDIVYLRTRSRWTEELEAELVRMARNNEPHINICDWPPD